MTMRSETSRLGCRELRNTSVPHPCDFFLSQGWEATTLGAAHNREERIHMKTSIKRIALLAALILAVTGPALSYAQTTQPTVDDARQFLDQANADLLKLGVAASHAEWIAETDITD